MKLKRRKLVALANAIAGLGNLKGIKFCYAIAKNNKKITEDLEDLRIGLKPSKRYREYDKKRIELCDKHAAQDENGSPKMVPKMGGPRGAMEYVGIVNNEKFQKEFEKLKNEYKGEIDETEKAQEEYEDALDGDVDFEFYMINYCDIPEDISQSQMNGIIDLVADEDEKVPKKKVSKKKE